MNLEDFFVMISLRILVMGYLKNILHYTPPLQKFREMC